MIHFADKYISVQIKNAVSTAQALAVNEKSPLSMLHIAKVLEVAETFEKDLKGGTGYEGTPIPPVISLVWPNNNRWILNLQTRCGVTRESSKSFILEQTTAVLDVH